MDLEGTKVLSNRFLLKIPDKIIKHYVRNGLVPGTVGRLVPESSVVHDVVANVAIGQARNGFFHPISHFRQVIPFVVSIRSKTDDIYCQKPLN